MSNISLPHIGRFITYEEVTGERVNIAEVIHLLSQLNIHGVLRIVATLNNCFVRPQVDKTQMRQLQLMLINQLFGDDLKQQLRTNEFARNINTVVFHRQQMLLILRLALMSCPRKRGRQWDTDAQHLFAEACLMANDLAGSRAEEHRPDEALLDLASSMIPVMELPSDEETCKLVGRSYDLWLDIPSLTELQTEKDFVPIATRFQAFYDVSLEHFLHGLYFLLSKLESFDPAGENPLDALVFSASLIGEGNTYPQASFKRVLSIISCTIATLQDKAITEPIQSVRYDFSILRRYPFIEVEPKVYLCFDRGFHRKFFTDGIYWLVFDALSPDEQKKFQSFFGKVFAIYVDRLLRYGRSKPGRHPTAWRDQTWPALPRRSQPTETYVSTQWQSQPLGAEYADRYLGLAPLSGIS